MRSLYPWPLFPSDVDSRATRSLSLQLSIQEWLSSFDCLAMLEKKPNEPHTLDVDVQKLLLFALDSPFAAKPGTLDKLCFYLHKLLATSTVTSKSPKTSITETLLDNMHDELLAFRNQINAWKRAPSSTEIIANAVQELCLSLRQTLLQFFDALLPFFEEARADENVLFYLIEHKLDINEVLQQRLYGAQSSLVNSGGPQSGSDSSKIGCSDGPPNSPNLTARRISHSQTIEHLLSHLYPSGPAHLRTILWEGYTRRGFTEFYAQHKTVIESLEWQTDQCSTSLST